MAEKKSRGRPKGIKNKIVLVRFTEADLEIIKQLANERKLPVATYVRLLAYKGLKSEKVKILKENDVLI